MDHENCEHSAYNFQLIQMGRLFSGDYFEIPWQISCCKKCGIEMTAQKGAAVFYRKIDPPDWAEE